MSTPELFVAWSNTKPNEAWKAYIGEKGEADVKIRKLNSGIVQIAIGDEDWKEIA